MTNLNVTTRKDSHGAWVSETFIPVDIAKQDCEGKPFLKIYTRKGNNGIFTSANVIFVNGTSTLYRVFHDFGVTVLRQPGRATQKTIENQQRTALEQVPVLLEAIAEHYANLA